MSGLVFNPCLKLVLLVCLSAFAKTGHAQFVFGVLHELSAHARDSVLRVAQSNKAPHLRSKAYYTLGLSDFQASSDSSRYYLRRAYTLATRVDRTSNPLPLYNASAALLNRHRRDGRQDSALYYAQQSLAVARLGSDSMLVSRGYNNRSTILRRTMDLEGATKDALRALELQTKYAPDDIRERTALLISLGRVRMERKDLEQAIATFQETIDLKAAHPEEVNRIQEGMALYFKVICLLQQERYEAAELALEAYAAFSSTRNSNHGHDAYLLRDTSLAIELYSASLSRHQQAGRRRERGIAASNLAQVYFDKAEYDKALSYGYVALAGDTLDRETEDYTLPIVYGAHQQRGQYDSAYAYLLRHTNLLDTLRLQEQRSRIDELEVRFATQQATADLALQEAKLKTVQTQRAGLLAALLGVASFAFIAIAFFRQRLKLSAEIAEQREALFNSQRATHQREQKLSAIRNMVRGQEAERKRIAQDLHDGLGSLLMSTKAHLTVSSNREATEHRQRGKGIALLDQAYGEVRRIAHALMPQALTFDKFSGAVSDLVEVLNVKGIATQVENLGPIDDLVPPDIQLSAYRILQELIANTLKHAGASEVFIQLLADEQKLVVVYEDNGRGFDTSLAEVDGLGLSGLRSRVDMHEGRIDLSSAPDEGVSYTLEFPLQREAVAPQAVSNSG